MLYFVNLKKKNVTENVCFFLNEIADKSHQFLSPQIFGKQKMKFKCHIVQKDPT